MRIPERSARTSSSVSKNHSRSSTRGSSSAAASARIALNPHWASENPAPSAARSDQVVGPGDQLALRAAHDPRAATQAGPDGQVRVPGEQGGQQRQNSSEVRGQIGVHVGQDGRIASRPDLAQCPAATLGGQVDSAHLGHIARQPAGDLPGQVGAGVVGDRDPEGVRQDGAQVGVQAQHAALQGRLLVVHRDHDVDGGGEGDQVLPHGEGSAKGRGGHRQVGPGHRVRGGHVLKATGRTCEHPVSTLCRAREHPVPPTPADAGPGPPEGHRESQVPHRELPDSWHPSHAEWAHESRRPPRPALRDG